VVVDDPAYPSVITVTDGSTMFARFGSPLWEQIVCIGYVDHGDRAAKTVVFTLAYADANGIIIGTDELRQGGQFEVGIHYGLSNRDQVRNVPNGNCRESFPVDHPITPGAPPTSTFTFSASKHAAPTAIADVLVSAREIDYVDGTSYHAAHTPQPGDRETLPAQHATAANPLGLPLVTPAAPISDAPFEMTDAIEEYGARVCPVFRNHRGVIATHVVIGDVLVARDGTVYGTVVVQSDGSFKPDEVGRMNENLCATMPGTFNGESFTTRPYRGSAAVAIGRIIVTPLEMFFSDGTSWRIAPPRPGSPAQFP